MPKKRRPHKKTASATVEEGERQTEEADQLAEEVEQCDVDDFNEGSEPPSSSITSPTSAKSATSTLSTTFSMSDASPGVGTPKSAEISKVRAIPRADTEPKSAGPEVEKKSSSLQLIRRPSRGTVGRPIQLYANFFPVTVKPNLQVYHYDLSVFRKLAERRSDDHRPKKPQKPANPAEQPSPEGYSLVSRMPRFLAVLILQQVYELNPRVFKNKHGLAFDGQKNLITTYSLDGISLEKTEKNGGKDFDVTINNPEKSLSEQFRVKIQFAAHIKVDLKQVFNRDLQERKSLATLVYDVVLKQPYFFDSAYIPQGRRIFYYPDPLSKFPLGEGVFRYPGFWQSLRPVEGWKIMINVDQANTSFVKDGKLLDILKFEFRVDPAKVDDRNIRMVSSRLEKLVKGIKVTQTHRAGHRTAKCTGVSRVSAQNLTFTIKSSDEKSAIISVADFFQQQHKARQFVKPLQYPNLPCLKLGSKSMIPLEFCEIKAGQRYPKKLNAGQTSTMLRVASQPADERKRLIGEDMNFLKMNQNPYLKEFGMGVSMEMVKFGGRVLPAATVEYKNQKLLPKDGGWNMRNVKLIDGCRIRKFGILCTVKTCGQNEITAFVREWRKSAIEMGMVVDSPSPAWMKMEICEDGMESSLKEAKNRVGPDLDLVFVILDGQNTLFYPNVKQAGDVLLGINTQCIQFKNVCNPKPATMANVNLKVNSKLGGINSKLTNNDMSLIKDLLREPILYLGADVNHSAPDDSEEPVSCAAIVGNVDLNPSVYCARIFLQSQELKVEGSVVGSRNVEYISQLREGVQMTIELFLKRNRVLPRRILMFRDGVGETMFGQVLTMELKQIQEACMAVERRYPDVVKKSGFPKDYRPPITFIVVQKRHHTRLFCVNPQDAMARNGNNVPPGTTVDTTIVHPEEFDFYLCSHLGLQGTSKPAHYHVLWDDSKFTADELQRLTYFLCHTYCRSTRTVSIPPPCYYADLVAYRARQYLKTLQRSDTETVTSTSSAGKPLTLLQNLVNVSDKIVEKGMYFV